MTKSNAIDNGDKIIFRFFFLRESKKWEKLWKSLSISYLFVNHRFRKEILRIDKSSSFKRKDLCQSVKINSNDTIEFYVLSYSVYLLNLFYRNEESRCIKRLITMIFVPSEERSMAFYDVMQIYIKFHPLPAQFLQYTYV